MVITIKNTSGLFSTTFQFAVASGANWFALEAKVANSGKEKLIIDANYQVGAHFKDELGNKYDGYIVNEAGVISSTLEIKEGEYYFVEEDALFD